METPDPLAPRPTGRIRDGAYVDDRYPLEVPVPAGWTPTLGAGDDPVRITLTDPDGDVTVRVTVTAADAPTPRAIAGCSWTFTDVARYRTLAVEGPIMAATCSPETPAGNRVVAWIVASAGLSWSVEGTIPAGHLAAGREDLDKVAATVRFR